MLLLIACAAALFSTSRIRSISLFERKNAVNVLLEAVKYVSFVFIRFYHVPLWRNSTLYTLDMLMKGIGF